jgi:hypothetical protein
LGLVVAGIVAVIWLAIAAVVSLAADGGKTAGSGPTYAAPRSTVGSTSRTSGSPTAGRTSTTSPRPPTPTQPPSGLQVVTSPAGLSVSIPAGWTIVPGAVPTNLQADEPGGTGVYVRFGGDPAAGGSLLATVTGYDADVAGRREGYQRLRLEAVSPRGTGETVEWEFLFVRDGIQYHAQGHYWRSDETEYVVYAAAPVASWDRAGSVLQVMIQTAYPT